MPQPRSIRDRFYHTPGWKAARRAALRRDGYRCVVCQRDVSGKGQARVDHVKPWRNHPHLALSLANLRTLCTLHDAHSHREKGRRWATKEREERFEIIGCDATGAPLNPQHHWRRPLGMPRVSEV